MRVELASHFGVDDRNLRGKEERRMEVLGIDIGGSGIKAARRWMCRGAC